MLSAEMDTTCVRSRWPFERRATVAFADRRGNPVLIGRELFSAIGSLEGDRGASQILSAAAGVIELPVEDAAVTVDIDTQEDLRQLNLDGR